MSEHLENADRAALRAMAHLLPQRWRRVLDLVGAPIPATPEAKVPAPDDPTVERLQGMEHIVVLMLENRSFDHMLGYLSLPSAAGGKGRSDIDGLQGPSVNFNSYDDSTYAIHHLDRTKFEGEAEDPDHSGASVAEQLSNGGGGFVANFARISAARAVSAGVPAPDPGLVMGYYNGDDLPVYDHFASEYCVVDRWFSSVPGATWPNRLYAASGQAADSHDDISPPIYALPSFVRHLDECDVSWRWYSFDPATLRGVDPKYRFTAHEHFAFLDARKLTLREEAVGELTEEGPSFLDDARNGTLPSVSWIDPHFKDLHVLGPDSNDDHPPSDVRAGQDPVLTVYHALCNSPCWDKTLLVVVYDEHGGFYDHVTPPPAVDDNPAFHQLGVRVPAFLVSPLVARGTTSTTLLGDQFHFDHTSLLKTILTRFCVRDGMIPAMTARVAAANHLGHLLSDDAPRSDVADHGAIGAQLAAWQSELMAQRFADPVGAVGPPRNLTDLQRGIHGLARALREAGLPEAHP